MIFYSTCFGFATVAFMSCSRGNVHAIILQVNSYVHQHARHDEIFFFFQYVYLSWADFDVEVTSLVGDLEDFWPGEAVDSQAVPVDEQTVGAHTEHDVNSF